MEVIKIPRKETQNHVTINAGLCKGCELCVKNCPKGVLKIGNTINLLGYKTVVADHEKCSGCGNCYYMCPEPAAIAVERNVPITPAKPKEKRAA
ncbi:MAG: 4Fe-4S dicluster domain-containing protein [Planctomycetaceae bacterium]|nr:4Fe-4S dicluster domain-containing protein [Planctomycetaceae bacterium]